jgi:hypothetical protein
VAYINGEKRKKLFTMKSNSSYSITHLSLSLSLFTLQQEEEKKQLLVVEGLPPSGLCFSNVVVMMRIISVDNKR